MNAHINLPRPLRTTSYVGAEVEVLLIALVLVLVRLCSKRVVVPERNDCYTSPCDHSTEDSNGATSNNTTPS